MDITLIILLLAAIAAALFATHWLVEEHRATPCRSTLVMVAIFLGFALGFFIWLLRAAWGLL